MNAHLLAQIATEAMAHAHPPLPASAVVKATAITHTLAQLHTTRAVATLPLEDLVEHVGRAAGPWLLTTKHVKGNLNVTTAMHAYTRQVLRAQHTTGATSVCKFAARSSKGAVVFVHHSEKLDEEQLEAMLAAR